MSAMHYIALNRKANHHEKTPVTSSVDYPTFLLQ